MHAAVGVAFGHLLVEDAAAGGHPLDVAGGHLALVAEAVAVLDFAGQDVGDGLDAAMRVPGEAGEVVGGILVAEVVEQEEGIELLGFAEAEGALELDACAFEGGLGFKNLFYRAKRHGLTSFLLTSIDSRGRYSLQQVFSVRLSGTVEQ